MKKQLNKLIKATILSIANAANAKDSVLFSQTLINLTQAKHTVVHLKSYK